MTQLTEFGKTVKKELIEKGWTQSDLVASVAGKTGQYVDGGYLYKIFTGQRSAPKIVQAIREILDLPDDKSA